MLVPLTNSLYVRGELSDTETVMVDVGTGFLIEKVRLCGAVLVGDVLTGCTEAQGGGAVL